jgi:hypothetical protein
MQKLVDRDAWLTLLASTHPQSARAVTRTNQRTGVALSNRGFIGEVGWTADLDRWHLDLLDLRLRQRRDDSALSPYDGGAAAIDVGTSEGQPGAA